MEPPDPHFFPTPSGLRAWFERHHAREDVLWVGYHRKATGRPSVTWEESVDVALCFGWIDGVRKSLDPERYVIRFTPRRPRSIWSDRNMRRMRALLEADLVAPAGMAAWRVRREDRSRRYSFEQGTVELPAELRARFEAEATAWRWFARQGAYYRRAATWWVVSARREDTRERRFETLVESSAAGRRIPPMRRTR